MAGTTHYQFRWWDDYGRSDDAGGAIVARADTIPTGDEHIVDALAAAMDAAAGDAITIGQSTWVDIL